MYTNISGGEKQNYLPDEGIELITPFLFILFSLILSVFINRSSILFVRWVTASSG